MTMRDLANAVGMEAASLYNHIKSKDEILKEICFSLGATYTRNMDYVINSDLSVLKKIEELIALHIKINFQSSSLASVMNDEWRHLKATDKADFIKKRHEYENNFINILKDGIAQGYLKEMEPRIVLFTIISSMRWLFHWYYLEWSFDFEQIKKTMNQMIFTSILKDSSQISKLVDSGN